MGLRGPPDGDGSLIGCPSGVCDLPVGDAYFGYRPETRRVRADGGDHAQKTAHELSDVELLGGDDLITDGDVRAAREHHRRTRLSKGLCSAPWLTYMWWRVLTDDPLGLPRMTPRVIEFIPIALLILMLGAALLVPLLGAGRSPHVLYRPRRSTSFADVKGAPVVVDEVVKTLNLFLAHKTFAEPMGGTPRRAILFEGPPGTGKTYLAKAMAAEAGVPFLFVSSSAFQSMFYGQTNRKIRSYFKALRKYARQEGGAIGFIEEIDAIGASRGGMGGATQREGIAGVVNELLIQLQSFDQPPDDRCACGDGSSSRSTGSCPRHKRWSKPPRRRPPTSWSSAPPTGPPTSTRPCCAPAASTARSTSTCQPRRAPRDHRLLPGARRPTTPSSTTRAAATRWRR